MSRRTPVVLLALAALLAGNGAAAKTVHEERSLYRHIVVVERGGERCMQFSVRRDQRNQSCIDLDEPERFVFTYTKLMMGALLLVPEPRRILMIGLGGGTLAVALQRLHPDATIDVVEIDPAVVQVAEDWFDWRDTGGIRTHVADGRVWIKRAGLRGERYDLVILDAFTGDYIPEHMVTAEFLEEVKALLTPDGIVAANTFRTSKLRDHESATYAAVFGGFWDLQLPESNNRVLLAGRTPVPADADSRALYGAAAAALAPRVAVHDVDPRRLLRGLRADRAFDRDARVLTDQFNPANILRAGGD